MFFTSQSTKPRDRATNKRGNALTLLLGASIAYMAAAPQPAQAQLYDTIDEALADYGPYSEEANYVRYDALETSIFNEELTSLPGTAYCQPSGECSESYYTWAVLSAQEGDERLYSTNRITSVFDQDDPDINASGLPPGRWMMQGAETQILCSIDRPMTIDITEEGRYLINYIDPSNPRDYIFGGVWEIDALYWDICHDRAIQANENMTDVARQLGYKSELEARETEVEVLNLPLTQEIIDDWTDTLFYRANPQLSGRKIRTDETEYIREWNAIQRIVPDLLVYDNNICGDTGWILESYDYISLDEGKGLVSEELNQVADAIFYARHPELSGRKIRPDETQLANEWSRIRTAVTLLHPCD